MLICTLPDAEYPSATAPSLYVPLLANPSLRVPPAYAVAVFLPSASSSIAFAFFISALLALSTILTFIVATGFSESTMSTRADPLASIAKGASAELYCVELPLARAVYEPGSSWNTASPNPVNCVCPMGMPRESVTETIMPSMKFPEESFTTTVALPVSAWMAESVIMDDSLRLKVPVPNPVPETVAIIAPQPLGTSTSICPPETCLEGLDSDIPLEQLSCAVRSLFSNFAPSGPTNVIVFSSATLSPSGSNVTETEFFSPAIL